MSTNWLSDDTIWQYFDLINDKVIKKNRITCLNPVICQAVKMLEDFKFILEPINLKRMKYIVLPVNDCFESNLSENSGGTHWSLLVYENERSIFYHYDSIRDHNTDSAKIISTKLLQFITGSPCVTAVVKEEPTPQQQNSYDCGIFTIIMAELIIQQLLDSNDGFTLNDHTFMPQLRECDLVTKRSQIAYAINNRLTIKPEMLRALFTKKKNQPELNGHKQIEIGKQVEKEDTYSKKNVYTSHNRIMQTKLQHRQIKGTLDKPQQYEVVTSNKYSILLNLSSQDSQNINSITEPINELEGTTKYQSNTKQRSQVKVQTSRKCPWVNSYQNKQTQKGIGKDKTNKTSIIIGDSIIKYIYQENCQVNAYPGIHIEELKKKIAMMSDIDRESFQTVILHIGTNDLKELNSPDDVMGRMYNLISSVKTLFPKSIIVINSIVRRRDIHFNLIKSTNNNIRWLCKQWKVIFMDLNKYLGSRCLGRDGLHLNRRGTWFLNKIITNVCKICNNNTTSIVNEQTTSNLHGKMMLNSTEGGGRFGCPEETYDKIIHPEEQTDSLPLLPDFQTAEDQSDNLSATPVVSMEEFPPLPQSSSTMFEVDEEKSLGNVYTDSQKTCVRERLLGTESSTSAGNSIDKLYFLG